MRQFLGYRFPDNIEIDVKITVNKAISHLDNFFPKDLRVFLTAILRDLGCRLPDDLNIFHKLKDKHPLVIEVLAFLSTCE
jgi:hypothetical protein